MHHDPDELFCQGCTSYVHPFLDACPVCGVARPSLYEAATAEPDQGLASLPSNPRVAQDVSEVVLRYFLKLNSASPTAKLACLAPGHGSAASCASRAASIA